MWPLPSAPAPASLVPTGPVFSTANSSSTQPLCVSVAGNSHTSGAAGQAATCIGGSGMAATAEPNGNIEINGLCLDTAGEATASGTPIALNTCSGSATQVWTRGTGYQLRNSGAGGLCLAETSAANGAALDITTCSAATTEQWRLPVM